MQEELLHLVQQTELSLKETYELLKLRQWTEYRDVISIPQWFDEIKRQLGPYENNTISTNIINVENGYIYAVNTILQYYSDIASFVQTCAYDGGGIWWGTTDVYIVEFQTYEGSERMESLDFYKEFFQLYNDLDVMLNGVEEVAQVERLYPETDLEPLYVNLTEEIALAGDNANVYARSYTDSKISQIVFPVTDLEPLFLNVSTLINSSAQQTTNEVLADARTYTDTEISQIVFPVTDLEPLFLNLTEEIALAGDNANAYAKSYTDTQISQIVFPVTDLEPMFLNVSTLINSTAQQTTNEALADARTYTDTQISQIVFPETNLTPMFLNVSTLINSTAQQARASAIASSSSYTDTCMSALKTEMEINTAELSSTYSQSALNNSKLYTDIELQREQSIFNEQLENITKTYQTFQNETTLEFSDIDVNSLKTIVIILSVFTVLQLVAIAYMFLYIYKEKKMERTEEPEELPQELPQLGKLQPELELEPLEGYSQYTENTSHTNTEGKIPPVKTPHRIKKEVKVVKKISRPTNQLKPLKGGVM